MQDRSRDRSLVVWVRALAVLLAAGIGAAAPHARAQTAPSARGDTAPYEVEYYYKAKWGYADEFLRLFKKNHYPLLAKQVESGRILKISAIKPRFHATEDGRWDFRVTLVFRDVAAAHDASGEDALVRRLYPDQETFKREEQRRFEILLAHWDVPTTDVDLEE